MKKQKLLKILEIHCTTHRNLNFCEDKFGKDWKKGGEICPSNKNLYK